MARIFQYDGREFPDPAPDLPVEAIRQQFAEFFPELVNADTREQRRGEDTVYTFSRRIGTKGRRPGRPAAVVGALRRVPAERLRVFELAPELIDAEGELDADAAGRRQGEVNLAVAEAEAYARHSRQARAALARLPAR